MPTPQSTTESHWHLKKEVQVGQLVSIFVFGITALLYITKMDQRIAIIEDKVLMQKERDDKQDARYSENIGHMNAQIDKIDSKLDRLIERK
jgi:hypothetical protein